MGACTGAVKASTDEFVYNVYGWKFDFDISDYDGWDVVSTAYPGFIFS